MKRIPPEQRARPFFATPLKQPEPSPPAVTWEDAILLGLDCETTGVDVATDRIWEWGAYWWGGPYSGTGESRLCDPERDLPKKLAEKLGVTPELWEEVRGARLFAEQAADFEATMGAVRRLGGVVVGWNVAPFDVEILGSELHRARASMLGWGLWTEEHRPTACLEGLPIVDGLALASWWRPELPSLSLGKVAESLGVVVPAGLHRTSVDAPLALALTRVLVEARMPHATLAAVVAASNDAVKVRRQARRTFGSYFAPAADGALWCRWGQAGQKLEQLDGHFLAMLARREDMPEPGRRRLFDELRARG